MYRILHNGCLKYPLSSKRLTPYSLLLFYNYSFVLNQSRISKVPFTATTCEHLARVSFQWKQNRCRSLYPNVTHRSERGYAHYVVDPRLLFSAVCCRYFAVSRVHIASRVLVKCMSFYSARFYLLNSVVSAIVKDVLS